MRATPDEMTRARQWVAHHLETDTLARTEETSDAGVPFSFIYDSRSFHEQARHWTCDSETRSLDAQRTEHVLTYTDPETGLQVRCVAILYDDFPAVEWVLYFKNTGSSDTPIIENIQALDTTLQCQQSRCVLHYSKGALCCMDDFAPVEQPLNRAMRIQLTPGGGRSSSEVLPFFNVATLHEGVVMGIGWTGEWQATFTRDDGDRVRIQAGMARTHFTLHPGEEVRSPRILLLFWQQDRLRGHNLLRQFLLTHHRPAPGGEPLVVPMFSSDWGATPAAVHLDSIQKTTAHDLPVEYYWIDAEWFGEGPWWNQPGNWDVKQDLYPQGFKPISDALHRSGRKFLLWFEPERVCMGTPWYRDHQEWLLTITPDNACYNRGIDMAHPTWVAHESHRNQMADGDALFNLANPEARQFLTDFVSQKIVEFGLDCFRHDANIAPLKFWQQADAEDRQGITEIRYVEGLYAMWDELLRRHPTLIIDNCASGGRRIDLETIGRSTAFWRTDYPHDPIGKQCHTYGLLSWVPLQSTGACFIAEDDDYVVRSTLCGGIVLGLGKRDEMAQVIPDDFPFELVKAKLQQYLSIRKFYEGDYFPLTQYSQAKDAWMAYQLDRPDLGEGLVVVLKRPLSPFASATFPLHALQTGVQYEITNMDTGAQRSIAGEELMKSGLNVHLSRQPDSALIRYRRVVIGD